jgi:hypothetical protein
MTLAATEVWQARIGRELAAQLRADSEVLGLQGRTEIVRAALHLLHVDDFYGGAAAPLPVGVAPAEDTAAEPAAAGTTARPDGTR